MLISSLFHIGLEGGNVVVSDRVVNGALQPEYQAVGFFMFKFQIISYLHTNYLCVLIQI